MKKRSAEKQCSTCKEVPQFGGSVNCLKCKIEKCQEEFSNDSEAEKWNDCNPEGQPYMLQALGMLAAYCKKLDNKNPLSILPGVLGEGVYDDWKEELGILLKFAFDGHIYSEDLIDMSVVRFERDVSEGNRNIWLTLCCVYDMGNYVSDLEEIRGKQKRSRKCQQ